MANFCGIVFVNRRPHASTTTNTPTGTVTVTATSGTTPTTVSTTPTPQPVCPIDVFTTKAGYDDAHVTNGGYSRALLDKIANDSCSIRYMDSIGNHCCMFVQTLQSSAGQCSDSYDCGDCKIAISATASGWTLTGEGGSGCTTFYPAAGQTFTVSLPAAMTVSACAACINSCLGMPECCQGTGCTCENYCSH